MISRAVSSHNGFTAIELLVVLGIVVLLSALAVPLSSGWHSGSLLDSAATQIIQTIRLAQNRSLARYNTEGHGVFFQINSGADRVILYQGSSYASRDANYDRVLELSTVLTLTTTLTGNEVNFSKGLGVPTTTGIITITHITSGSRTLSLNSIGTVEQ